MAFFELDDVEYAGRFAKALRHAVELCVIMVLPPVLRRVL